ncbi:dihydroorotate dehydrogenase electron transfer subunit [Thermophilibacter sp.]|uniref:dihydroorotate dehydrogenase electron transfer subunit n=1 Tax=Thermophilibacter sp. TaxID=2847309 RepID=UPI003A92A708
MSAGLAVHEVTVVSNEAAADGLMRVVLSAPALAAAIEPGQFVNVHVPGDASQILRIPLSFSCADAEAGTVEIVYAVVGDGTHRLAALEAGERTTAVGPCGNPWPAAPGARRACVVAGGVGVTPVVACARMLAAADVPFDAVVGAQTAARLWGADVLEGLGAGVVAVTTDDGTAGRAGFTTDALADLLAKRCYDVVYTCGPEVMMAGIARLCHEAGVRCLVSMERMMCCGFGACGTCNVAMVDGTYKSCCKDGPVFDAEEVAW